MTRPKRRGCKTSWIELKLGKENQVQLGRTEDLLRQGIQIQLLARIPLFAEKPNAESTSSMPEFNEVKENISKIKKDMWKMKGYTQHTYNNIVDMPGLAF